MVLTRHSTEIADAGLADGQTIKSSYGLRERITGIITLIRPVFMVLTPLNAASAAVLAIGGYPSIGQCILGFSAVALASVAVNTFNDYVDRNRDKVTWPDRPIPSGRVRPNHALAIVIISIVASLSISLIFFNPTTFYILLIAIVLGSVYSFYLRDRVGYLSLPPIVGLIYPGGWAAFSPETLYTSFLPWYLYLLGVVWQTGHIMVYYPLHLAKDIDGKYSAKTPQVFFFTPSPKAAVRIGIVFAFITLLLAAILPILAPLGVIYLVLIIPTGIYALFNGIRLLEDVTNREKGLKAFGSLTIFRLVISSAILLQILLA